ncbi:MAG: rhomboid family intramembrane serine protease [Vampirovibrionia bacterium]
MSVNKREYLCPKCGCILTLGNCVTYKRGYLCIDCAKKRRIDTVNPLEKKQIFCRVCSKEIALGDMAIYPTSIICKDCDTFFKNSHFYISHTKKSLSFLNYSATLSLLILIAVIYFISSLPSMQQINSVFIEYGALIPSMLFEGQYWRLITPNFLHADLSHLFSNSVSIAIWGHLLERYIGSKNVFLLIIMACFFTTSFSAFFSPNAVSLGASGIAYALMSAFVIYAIFLTVSKKPQAFKGQLVSFLVLVVFQIAFNYFDKATIDVWGHLGGAVCGIVFIIFYALFKAVTLFNKPIK